MKKNNEENYNLGYKLGKKVGRNGVANYLHFITYYQGKAKADYIKKELPKLCMAYQEPIPTFLIDCEDSNELIEVHRMYLLGLNNGSLA